MEGDSHNISLTVFSVRSQSPELRFLARDWGRGRDGVCVCERPLGGLAFYLPTWWVPIDLGQAPILFPPAPWPLGSGTPGTRKGFIGVRQERTFPCAITRETEA